MQRFKPRLPRRPLGELSDDKRKIGGGPVWNLQAAQRGLQEGRLRPLTTKNVSDALNTGLGWSLTDVKNGFLKLRTTHYHQSEWVWVQGLEGEPLPADSYLLPCETVPEHEEDPTSELQVYMKFTLPAPSRHVFFVSIHLSN